MKQLAKTMGLAMAALALAPAASAQTVKTGIEAWQRADYAAALRIWRPLAEKGDADAAFNLGQAYRLGRGVAINLATAQRWFEQAADEGQVDAQATLGLLLFDSGDRAEGIKWLRSAADRGEPRSMLIYGTALFNGDSVTRDSVLAYALISRAAAQCLAPATATLAQARHFDAGRSAEEGRCCGVEPSQDGKGIAAGSASERKATSHCRRHEAATCGGPYSGARCIWRMASPARDLLETLIGRGPLPAPVRDVSAERP